MRAIPAGFQAELDSGASTLCWCWRIDRRDGVSYGFTDHDAALSVVGFMFEPDAALDPTAFEASADLAIDNVEVAGVLQSSRIKDEDVDKGLFDSAEVRLWRVNWRDPSSNVLVFRGALGEIRRRGLVFEAEMRSLSDKLSDPIGRNLLPTCDAVLGDARCGVDLQNPAYRAATSILVGSTLQVLIVSGLGAFEANWFSRGRLLVDGLDLAIAEHRRAFGQDRLVLVDSLASLIAIGAAATVVAGCDKRLATCGAKFANLSNFRGFPHVPGADWAVAYPKEGRGYDGASRNDGQ